MTQLYRLTLSLIVLLGVPFGVAQTAVHEANITFTAVDVPGAGVTIVYGINRAGDLVGAYGADTSADHGFLLRNAEFTYIDYPGAVFTSAYGINDAGLIVGSTEFNGRTEVRGFLYDGAAFTLIRHGNDAATYCLGLSNNGDIVGGTGSVGGSLRAFVLRNDRFRAINFPGQPFVAVANSINSLGRLIGYTEYDSWAFRSGNFKKIEFPGAVATHALGINDSGIIVGWYFLDGTAYGFALRNGKYLWFRYPGAQTTATGINASGQIVGAYTFDYQTWHGFVTSPITAAAFEAAAGV